MTILSERFHFNTDQPVFARLISDSKLIDDPKQLLIERKRIMPDDQASLKAHMIVWIIRQDIPHAFFNMIFVKLFLRRTKRSSCGNGIDQSVIFTP